MATLRICATLFALATVLSATVEDLTKPKKWALLVAGSNGWDNYGDQADVCHSYHTVRRHGIPEENIIVMIFDDVANDPGNPNPGTLINRINGSDVYKGVKKDYTGNDVNPENFLKVLRGDKMTVGSKRSIKSYSYIYSGPNDELFVYFIDHGGPGFLCFPNDELSVKDLTDTLKSMHQHKKYKKLRLNPTVVYYIEGSMFYTLKYGPFDFTGIKRGACIQIKKLVFFVDACYSGSMFDGQITAADNIYAQTAANADEVSYFCQLDDTLQTFVNSDFDYNWKVDADTENIDTERIEHEYEIVQNETTRSHVSEYGNLDFRKLDVAEFLGHKAATPIPYPPKVPCWNPGNAVNKNEAEYAALQRKAENAKDESQMTEALAKLNDANRKRVRAGRVIRRILSTVLSLHGKPTGPFANIDILRKRGPITKPECHHVLLKTFSNVCYPLSKNPYLLRYMNVLSNFCDAGFEKDVVVDVLHQVCGDGTLDTNVV